MSWKGKLLMQIIGLEIIITKIENKTETPKGLYSMKNKQLNTIDDPCDT